ncbi:GAF domain-containing protein [Xylophilus sp. GW821-FHT01B05]
MDDGALSLPPAVCLALCQALPRAPGLDEAMHILNGVRQQLLGEGLLTVNIDATPGGSDADGETIELQRLWTSNPQAYPIAGRKRKAMTPWTRQLLQRGEVFVGEGGAALAEVFDDHARIAVLGLQAVVNVPLLDEAGACVATFNVLGTRPRWLPRELMLVRLLAVVATPWVLRVRSRVVLELAAVAHSSG